MQTSVVYQIGPGGLKRADDGPELKRGMVLMVTGYGGGRERGVVLGPVRNAGEFRVVYPDGRGDATGPRLGTVWRASANAAGIGGFLITDETALESSVLALEREAEAKKAAELDESKRIAAESAQRAMDALEAYDKNAPKWAKAALIAVQVIDESDTMTDYYSHKTGRRILLAWSKHTRDIFSEMRKAARGCSVPEVSALADASSQAEHREKYSMGGGYYLKAGSRHSTGWKIEKTDRKGLVGECILSGQVELEDKRAPKTRGAKTEALVAAGCSISEQIHTKHGFVFWIVSPAVHLGRERFMELSDLCRQTGGWYSRRWGSSPAGFGFKDQDAALAFAAEHFGDGPDGDGPDGPAGPGSGASVASAPAPDVALADRLADMAERARDKVADMRRPSTQNWTPKRGREEASRLNNAEQLEACAVALQVLADAWRAGEVPAEFAKIRTKKAVEGLTSRRWADCRGGYYDTPPLGDHRDQSAQAVAFREWVKGRLSPADPDEVEHRKKADAIKREVDSLRGLDIDGFFPTPSDVVARMIEEAQLAPGQTILEPSAGKGDLALAIREAAPDASLTCVEINARLAGVLELHGFRVIREDFLDIADPEPNGGLFDRVLMNPPFERGAAEKHIRHAFGMLRDGGRLVALAPCTFVEGGTTEFQEWVEALGWWEDLGPCFSGSDAFRRTGVRVMMIVLDN